MSLYQANIRYIPTDEIMQILINDSTTTHWNPLVFCIFYQRFRMLEYLCTNPLVYVRGCLVKPFQMSSYEEEDLETNINDDEHFI